MTLVGALSLRWTLYCFLQLFIHSWPGVKRGHDLALWSTAPERHIAHPYCAQSLNEWPTPQCSMQRVSCCIDKGQEPCREKSSTGQPTRHWCRDKQAPSPCTRGSLRASTQPCHRTLSDAARTGSARSRRHASSGCSQISLRERAHGGCSHALCALSARSTKPPVPALPAGTWGTLSNIFFFGAAIFSDLLLLRAALVLAYVSTNRVSSVTAAGSDPSRDQWVILLLCAGIPSSQWLDGPPTLAPVENRRSFLALG